MQFSSPLQLAGLLAFAATANAHLQMMTPAPFPGYNSGPWGPQPDGTFNPFPCQGKMTGGTATDLKLGSSGNKLVFKGSAVHSGGSCQVSLTYEANLTKDTVWRTITSFHGGCPIKFDGNMPPNAEAVLDSGLTYDVPADIPAGDAKIAWTWINKSGHREFYMQCGPVKLSGPGGPKANFEKLPEMVVANVEGFPCKTEEGKDYKFKNPGSKVVTAPGLNLVTLECGAGGGGGGGGDAAPAPAGPPAPAPGPAPAPAAGGGGGGGCTSGAFKCVGDAKFQQCANGAWAAEMAVAAGTKCQDGKFVKRSVERLHVRDFEWMPIV
ncbi:hypothetical protein MCOR27_011050 [Pyricularia oryzae]|uniref:Lytic polysaccharide monooxygenase n=2 Tax=Pyricularia TaxID=48558 RepID=A0ABQ8N5U1_PYRGI|nr:hypothetical protein MCOR01_011550 [Pyricularia oryzae]KAI6290879.1 hypothetical protein MCOR33_010988 [Pyricularia grisea]KAH9436155.1 hypothetical protein MCOR02_005063 [Pyricularia oryzae]KAI6257193.1 hypothetical protein MCOR19_006390 [Pyricularia oryzae]KAI6266374.1 hypothetical protein MCOR27_011050 [Pyricularia oryzae]